MSWRVVVRPQVQDDVIQAAEWYDARQEGLGAELREAVIQVFDALAVNPLLNSRRHPRKNLRWRYPERFPYRVIYEVIEEEKTVVIAAVLHAARHDRHWKRRVYILGCRLTRLLGSPSRIAVKRVAHCRFNFLRRRLCRSQQRRIRQGRAKFSKPLDCECSSPCAD